jgi:hypothetical protein
MGPHTVLLPWAMQDSLTSARVLAVQAPMAEGAALAEVLRDEALSQRLSDLILYGIAMADTDQEAPSASGPVPTPAASSAAPSASPAGASGVEASAAASQPLSLAQGAAALELLTTSAGRFGAQGPFMLPSYGSGSLAEALVRLAAVHGAVTVLRQPVQALLVGNTDAVPTSQDATSEAAEGAGREEGSPAPNGAAEGSAGSGGSGGAEAAAAQDSGGRCRGVVTASGQLIRCSQVVAGVGTLRWGGGGTHELVCWLRPSMLQTCAARAKLSISH